MTKLRVLSLFAGIGGFDLGLERTGGFETIAFCERELTAARLAADGITVDVICGGFPCQDISVAGKGAGIADGTRSGLWSEYARLIGELRPRFVIVENVAELLSNGMGRVCGDLAGLRYDAEWQDVSAEDIGAPHPRSRIWIVAYPSSAGLERLWCSERAEAQISVTRSANDDTNSAFVAGLHGVGKRGLSAVVDANPHRPSWAGQQWPETQPLLCRVGDGIPNRVDRTSALGNAVVPVIPEIIGRALLTAIADRNPQGEDRNELRAEHESGGAEGNRTDTGNQREAA